MSFVAILYREKEITKKYFLNFLLSQFINTAFFTIVFLILGENDFSFERSQKTFLLVNYLTVSTQIQIFCQIYNLHDKQEKIFEQIYLTFKTKVQAFTARLSFLLAFNLIFFLVCCAVTQFKFENSQLLFVFSISLVILISNYLSIHSVVANNKNKFIIYLSQLLLLPLNLPALILIDNPQNLVLIVFSVLLSSINVLITCLFSKSNI